MNTSSRDFNFEKAVADLRSGKPVFGNEGTLTPLLKELTEAALEGELDSHLSQEVSANRRNGKSRKTVKSLNGSFELKTPRDRCRNF